MRRIISKVSVTAALCGLCWMTVASCGTSAMVADTDSADIVNGSDEVNVGYGTVSKDELNNAVSKVKVNDRTVQSYSSIWDYIAGRVPGVIIRGGGMGDTPQIYVRGIGTNSGETQPLILVDGVERGSITYLSPEDVASVEVIKDASASIYGLQGANGVILITTKAAKMLADQEAAAKKAARQAKKGK